MALIHMVTLWKQNGKKGKKELTQQFCCPAQLCERQFTTLSRTLRARREKKEKKEQKKSLLAKFSPKTPLRLQYRFPLHVHGFTVVASVVLERNKLHNHSASLNWY